VKLLNLLHINEIEISAPKYTTHYSPVGNCDVLDIFVCKNIRLSKVIFSDILDSHHPPIVFHSLDHIATRNLSHPVDKFTDWERFQSLSSELISPRIQIYSMEEDDKVARDLTVCIALAYRLSRSKITISDLNKDGPGLESLLKYTQS
jgi:hypothetical protein